MGFLKSLVGSVGSVTKKALDANLALFAAPVTTITKGVSAGIKKVEKQSAAERTLKILGTTATAAGAVLTGGTAVGRSAAAKVITSTTSAVGKAFAAKPVLTSTAIVAAPAVVSVAVKKPKETLTAPVKVAKASYDVGSLVAEPSVSGLKEFVSEHPVATGLIAGGAAVAGGAVVKAAAPIIGGLVTKGAIEKQTEALTGAVTAQPTMTTPTQAPVTQVKATGSATPTAPVTPEVKTVTKTPSKKRRKRRTAPKTRNINQRVNVVVQTRARGNTIKNYLKERALTI